MSGKMPGRIAPSISECARPSVNPDLEDLSEASRDADLSSARTISGASLPRARKRHPVSASLRRARAARLLRARYREDNFWNQAVCSAPGGVDRRTAPKGARRDRLLSGIGEVGARILPGRPVYVDTCRRIVRGEYRAPRRAEPKEALDDAHDRLQEIDADLREVVDHFLTPAFPPQLQPEIDVDQ